MMAVTRAPIPGTATAAGVVVLLPFEVEVVAVVEVVVDVELELEPVPLVVVGLVTVVGSTLTALGSRGGVADSVCTLIMVDAVAMAGVIPTCAVADADCGLADLAGVATPRSSEAA